jgi:hypothetical protein
LLVFASGHDRAPLKDALGMGLGQSVFVGQSLQPLRGFVSRVRRGLVQRTKTHAVFDF